MESGNTVYWLTNGCYDIPCSPKWRNCMQDNSISSFGKKVESIAEKAHVSTGRFVVVTDSKSREDMKTLNSKILSNNIIDIGGLYDKEKVRKNIEWILSDFGKDAADSDNVFFTSDTHFSHSNIIKYCNRPWNGGVDGNGDMVISDEDVKSMNEEMIRRWNSVVPKDALVYHLGDFCLGRNQREEIPELVSRLNGKISLVMGNHDRHPLKFYYEAGFHRVYDRPIVIDQFFILSHAPIQWVRDGLPYANLYGHVHNQEMYRNVTKNSFNCCVEVNDYTPVSKTEIIRRMEEA